MEAKPEDLQHSWMRGSPCPTLSKGSGQTERAWSSYGGEAGGAALSCAQGGEGREVAFVAWTAGQEVSWAPSTWQSGDQKALRKTLRFQQYKIQGMIGVQSTLGGSLQD